MQFLIWSEFYLFQKTIEKPGNFGKALTYLEIRKGIFCGSSTTNDIIKPTALVLLILKFSGFSAQLLLAIYYSSSFQETNSPKEN